VNSNLTTDTMIAANPTGTLQDDEPTVEMKLPTRAEIAAHLAQKGRCELFEGGLGILEPSRSRACEAEIR
jgi:hypothetical protein